MGILVAALPSLISAAGVAVLGVIAKLFTAFLKEHKLLMEAERNDLKSHIVAIYERAKERGYITPMELDTVNRLFDSYKALGGNSYIEAIMHDMNNCMRIVGMPVPAIVAAMDAAGREKND